ncbi:hypothetical protein NE237_029000 [Protea cynaroides]|uniref:Late embryogenesis abundant protein LEA-2 subgroup domain-containing protein n=1 Tax=Protea cynaroides TaxID=273540 RepID=A0A9Q0GR13_9MAGN|nr:hypothetical protein NE237_029000 [Protea cynaroides]
MTDRIYPSKPASNPPQKLNGNANPPFPATKAQSFNRPMYRPQPKPSRRRRSCCCICCLWTTLLIGTLILLAAIAGVVIWILYRPQHPTFSVTAVRISQFNVTTNKDGTSQLNSNLDLTVSTRNPNKKLVFFYDPTTVTMSSAGIDVGNSTFPAYTHGTKNTTVLRTTVASTGESLESSSASSLKSDLKKGGIPLAVQLDTKMKVKMGGLKTDKLMIRVICDRLKTNVPKGKTPATLSSSSDTTCKVKLRIKIWKWTF